MKQFLLFLFFLPLVTVAQVVRVTSTVDIEKFGAKGDNVTNDYPAFFAAAASSSDVIHLRAKTYYLNNGVGTITQQLAAMVMLTNKYIVGEPGTVIRFASIATPLFTLYDGDYGGITQVDFVFSGNTITAGAQQPSKAQFMTKLGVTTLSGGDVKEIGPVYVFNSNNIKLRNLTFKSATPNDITKMMGIVITARAREDIPRYTYGFEMTNITFNDYQNGALICSEKDAVVSQIYGGRRGGVIYYPPGHVIYFSANNGITENTLTCDGVFDNGQVIPGSDMEQCIATIAPKYMRNCKVTNVTSYHPNGILQSFDNANGNTFTNFSWYYDGETSGSFMNFVAPSGKPSENNTFDGFNIITPNSFNYIACTSALQNLFNGNVFKNFYFRMQANYNSDQVSSFGVFDVYGYKNQIEAVVELTEPVNTANYNTLVVFRGVSDSNEIHVRMAGQYDDIRVRRPLQTAGTRNKFDLKPLQTTTGKFASAQPAWGALMETEVKPTIWGKGGTSSTGTGLTDTFTLRQGPGVYLVTATISNNSVPATALSSSTYRVVWNGSVFGVSAVGGNISLGTGYSNLALTIDNTGLVTVTFDKVPTGASRLAVGYQPIAGLGSEL